jgi:hypothetical protein
MSSLDAVRARFARNEDHSCRDAVSRIIAHRAANGMAVCSPNTASYCTARSRIPTRVLSTLARRTAEELHTSVDDRWKWIGGSVFILDGSSVSMPDAPENQAMYPQPPNYKPGLGLPPCRRPPRTLGTAGAQTTPEESREAYATSTHCQAASEPVQMVLAHLAKTPTFNGDSLCFYRGNLGAANEAH